MEGIEKLIAKLITLKSGEYIRWELDADLDGYYTMVTTKMTIEGHDLFTLIGDNEGESPYALWFIDNDVNYLKYKLSKRYSWGKFLGFLD